MIFAMQLPEAMIFLYLKNMSLVCLDRLTFSKFLNKIPMIILQIRVKICDGIMDSLQFWFVDRP